ncbi:MAG: DUF4350 domain-containing protein [Candidatus Polarisedimenticolia bacterium]
MTLTGAAGLMLVVCLVMGRLGPIDSSVERLGLAAGVAAWGCSEAFRSAAVRRAGWSRRLAAMAVLAPAAGLLPVLAMSDRPVVRLAWICLAACLTASPGRAASARIAGFGLGMTLLLEHAPLVWRFEVALSRTVSGIVGTLTGQAIDFGPSASGLDLLLLFVMACASAGGPARIRGRLLCCLAAWLGAIALAPTLSSWSPAWLLGDGGLFNRAGEHLAAGQAGQAPAIYRWSWGWFALLCLICWGWRRSGPEGNAAPESSRSRVTAWAAGLTAALVVAPAWDVTVRPVAAPDRGTILLVRSPLFDLDVPVMERLGIQSSGMLGLLGRYLKLGGHDLIVRDRPLDEGLDSRARTVIVMLPPAPFEPEEKRALDAFVRRGGSLLVLADHTDLFETMGPINDLIDPYGVRVRFDSAYPARREWKSCLRPRPPLGIGRTGIGTGCSLQLRGLARPLVIGTHALSDAGNRHNTGAGAYLGDYAYQPGEQLGDLVLAAEARAGRGRVVVMGDTSSFQNVALPWSAPFVIDLFDELARPVSMAGAVASGILGLAGLALLWLCMAASCPVRWVAGAACGILVACLAGAAVPGPSLPLPEGHPVALVDDGHLNGFERELWHEGSIGGLLTNLQRQGWLPIVSQDAIGALRGPDMLAVVVDPGKPLARAEAARLSAHIESGGRVLVAAGGHGGGAVEPLLAMYGLRVGTLPLGPVPVRPDLTREEYERALLAPQFRNAWPLESSGSVPVRSFYQAFGYDVVARASSRSPSGGALIVIADPEFLTDRVLENESTAWKGNVDLLARLLERDPS